MSPAWRVCLLEKELEGPGSSNIRMHPCRIKLPPGVWARARGLGARRSMCMYLQIPRGRSWSTGQQNLKSSFTQLGKVFVGHGD